MLGYGFADKPNGTWIACSCGRIDNFQPKRNLDGSPDFNHVNCRPTSQELWDLYLSLGWTGTPENCKCPDCVKMEANVC